MSEEAVQETIPAVTLEGLAQRMERLERQQATLMQAVDDIRNSLIGPEQMEAAADGALQQAKQHTADEVESLEKRVSGQIRQVKKHAETVLGGMQRASTQAVQAVEKQVTATMGLVTGWETLLNDALKRTNELNIDVDELRNSHATQTATFQQIQYDFRDQSHRVDRTDDTLVKLTEYLDPLAKFAAQALTRKRARAEMWQGLRSLAWQMATSRPAAVAAFGVSVSGFAAVLRTVGFTIDLDALIDLFK